MPKENTKETVDFNGVKDSEKLKNFVQALPSVLAKSDTKKVIRAASEGGKDGDWSNYTDAIKNLSLKGIRDYNFVLVIFSPIIAAMQSIINYVNVRGHLLNQPEDAQYKDLKNLVDKVFAQIDFTNLCAEIGKGNGPEIKNILERFSYYKILLRTMSNNTYGRSDDKFVERAGKITPWKVNGKYIEYKLIPFIHDVFTTKYTNAIKGGLVTPPPSTLPPDAKALAAPKLKAPAAPQGAPVVTDLSAEYGASYSAAQPSPRPPITSATQITLANLLLEIKDGHFEKVPMNVLQQNGFLKGLTLIDITPNLIIIQTIVKDHYSKTQGQDDKTKKENFIKNFTQILHRITLDIGSKALGNDQNKSFVIMRGLIKCLKHK